MKYLWFFVVAILALVPFFAGCAAKNPASSHSVQTPPPAAAAAASHVPHSTAPR